MNQWLRITADLMAHDHLDKPESRIQRCVAMSDRHRHRQQHPRLMRAGVEPLARFLGRFLWRKGHRIEGVQLGFLAGGANVQAGLSYPVLFAKLIGIPPPFLQLPWNDGVLHAGRSRP